MKMRFAIPRETPPVSSHRGAAPVGILNELPQVELAAIIYLRAWCAGGADREIIAKDFCLVMGQAEATLAVEDFDALMTTLLNSARRPVMRHGLGCTCFGGDESAFANMIAAAASQDHEDAMLFASTLMAGHAAWSVVQLATRLGQVFLRLSRVPDHMQVPTVGAAQTTFKH